MGQENRSLSQTEREGHRIAMVVQSFSGLALFLAYPPDPVGSCDHVPLRIRSTLQGAALKDPQVHITE
jgi:hypothetical protein